MRFLPNDVPTLIQLLEETYPERCILPEETAAQAQRRAGQRDVVNFLNQLRQKTERKQLKDQLSIGG